MIPPPPTGHLEWLQVSLLFKEAISQYVAVAYVDVSDPSTPTFYGQVVLTDWRNNPEYPFTDPDAGHRYIKRIITLTITDAGILKKEDADALGSTVGTSETEEEKVGVFSDPTVDFETLIGTWDDLQSTGVGQFETLLEGATEDEWIVSNGFKKNSWQGWSFPNGDPDDPGGWASAARMDGGEWDEVGGVINSLPPLTLYDETTGLYNPFGGFLYDPPVTPPSVGYPKSWDIGYIWSGTLNAFRYRKIGQPVPIRIKAKMGHDPGSGGDPTDESDVGASMDTADEYSAGQNTAPPSTFGYAEVVAGGLTRSFTKWAIYAPDIGQDYD